MKKGVLLTLVIVLCVLGLGVVNNFASRRHGDDIYRQTSVADKGKAVINKITGQQVKGKVPEDKKDTGQTVSKDTGQPEPKDTGQPTATAEAVIQVSAEKKEAKKDKKKDITVQITHTTEGYDNPTHIEGYQKVVDLPQGETLTHAEQIGLGWLKGVCRDRLICVYYDSTDYDVSDEEIVYSKSLQGVIGRAKTRLTLREAPIVTTDLSLEKEVEKNTEFTILYYAQTRGGLFSSSEWYFVEIKLSTESTGGWVRKEKVSIDTISNDKDPVMAMATSTSEPKATEEPMPTPTLTATPSKEPTLTPTATPTDEPTAIPTDEPTAIPTDEPTASPFEEPRSTPTATPIVTATPKPKATAKPNETVKPKEFTITLTKETPIYEEPDDKAKVIGMVPAGGKIRKVKEATIGRGWLCGEIDGEIIFFRYLYTDYAKKAGLKPKTVKRYDKPTYAIVTGNGVNFRVAPGVTTEVKDCLSKSTELQLISKVELITGEADWYKAKNLRTGKVNYICALYVKKVSALEEKKEEIVRSERMEQLQNDREEIGSKEKEKKVATKKKKEETASKKTKSSKASVATMQAYAKKLLKKYGWGNEQFPYVVKIGNRESGWNPDCEYNNCSGIFQRNTKAHGRSEKYETDWKEQVRWGLQYIKTRYGTPKKAWQYRCKNNSY